MSLDTTVGTATAEAYISVADTDTYHSNRGNTAWALLDTPTKEQCLRRSTDYMVGTYRSRWKGIRNDSIQILDWPRLDVQINDVGYGYILQVVDPTIIPVEVKNANAELALIASTADLDPTIGQNVIKEVIGPLSTEYDPYSPQNNRYPKIDRMVSIYLMSASSSSIKLNRT